MDTDTDPVTEGPPRGRRLRVAAVVFVVAVVWGSLWFLGRSAAPSAPHPATAPNHPASAAAQPPATSGTSREPPTFSQAPGWNVRTGETVPAGSRDLPMALAANVPIARQDVTFIAAYGLSESAPAATISSLPPGGVVVVALLPFPPGIGPAPPHFGDFPDRQLPLRLSDGRVNRQWASQPRPGAPEYDVWGRVEGTYVEVSVYFGAPRPSSATYAAAQAELARLTLPGVPSGSARSAWTTNDVGALTIQTPPGWRFSGNPSPLAELAEGNWPFPDGGSCGPEAALDALPRDGALAWISETVLGPSEGGFPPRPARFSLRGLRAVPRECSGTTYLLQFRDHGRAFQAQIALGPDASAATKSEVLRSLSSLRVRPGEG
jgi:hypothetical protein